jgi:toxin ParE1/3/4
VKVRFTPSARREFLEAIDFIRLDSPFAAEAMLARSRDGLAQLHDFPESGRLVPEFPDSLYREILVSPYRFFYRISDDTVWVVGVWHDRQLPVPPDA